ncbi:MAG TPA: FAD-linked oxidase C-terminal domain-containing protein [Steroidobacteraceae bacterium]|nr:FAD-linked oxidase C-terminal domain-containing protein [Steroidobacteraceae bacterium]
MREVEETVYRPLAAVAGSISGEHGICLEKRDYLYYSRNETEIEVMCSEGNPQCGQGVLNGSHGLFRDISGSALTCC